MIILFQYLMHLNTKNREEINIWVNFNWKKLSDIEVSCVLLPCCQETLCAAKRTKAERGDLWFVRGVKPKKSNRNSLRTLYILILNYKSFSTRTEWDNWYKWILVFVIFFFFSPRKWDIPWKDLVWWNEQLNDPRRQTSSFSHISWMFFKSLSWPAVADHRKNVSLMNCCMSWHTIQL